MLDQSILIHSLTVPRGNDKPTLKDFLDVLFQAMSITRMAVSPYILLTSSLNPHHAQYILLLFVYARRKQLKHGERERTRWNTTRRIGFACTGTTRRVMRHFFFQIASYWKWRTIWVLYICISSSKMIIYIKTFKSMQSIWRVFIFYKMRNSKLMQLAKRVDSFPKQSPRFI